MGWFGRFVAIITCRSCKTEDGKALEQRNRLRRKLKKNKVEPLAPTDLDVKEREDRDSGGIPTPSERGSVVGVNNDYELTPEEFWASPTTESRASTSIKGSSTSSGSSSDLALVDFARHYVKTEILPAAIQRFLAEKEQNKITGSVSDLVQLSLPKAKEQSPKHMEVENNTDEYKNTGDFKEVTIADVSVEH